MVHVVAQRALIAHRSAERAGSLARVLRDAGFAVRCVASGARAFLVASRWKPQLVVLEDGLPDPSADEICRELKAGGTPVPMILLVAAAPTPPGAADACLSEPFLPATLLEQVRLLENLATARAERDAAERRLHQQGVFFASAAHDLRQPAHAVRLFLSALEARLADAGQRQLLDHALEGLSSLEGLLNRLMDASALEHGEVKPKLEPLDLGELVASVCVTHAPEAACKGLALRIRARPAVVTSDRVLVERILRNLVVNALRYTQSGGVLVASRPGRSHVALEVWDTGVGIAPDQLDGIFEAFHRLDAGPGHGLGLAVVARTARMLGHKVSVASRPGRGSVFRLHLPLAAAAAARPLALSPTACAACPPSPA